MAARATHEHGDPTPTRSAADFTLVEQAALTAGIQLEAGQPQTVQFDLLTRAFARWDGQAAAWTVRPGEREILVRASSRDLRKSAHIVLKEQDQNSNHGGGE